MTPPRRARTSPERVGPGVDGILALACQARLLVRLVVLLLGLRQQRRGQRFQPAIGRQANHVGDAFGFAPGVQGGDGEPAIRAQPDSRLAGLFDILDSG